MRLNPNATKFKYLWIAVFACLVVAAATNAYAVPPNEAGHDNSSFNVIGLCCTFWGRMVLVTEPATPVPVIISWSADYAACCGEDAFKDLYAVVGLSVNGGPCQTYGARALYPTIFGIGPTDVASRTFRWVVFPTDGPPANLLHKGVNSFELCGGGEEFDDQVTTIVRHSMAARLSQ